jgi:tetratricopeptide (TPR) repeat protein
VPCPSIRFGVAAILGPLIAGVLAVAAPRTASAVDSAYSAYLTLVERSCTRRDQALQALSRWSRESLEEVGQQLYECEECRTTRSASSSPANVDAACGCESPPWSAAAVLHTVHAFTSPPGLGSQFHLSFAARLQENARDDAFRRQWHLAAGLGCLYRVDLPAARSHLEQGLELFDDDPALLMALGASYEVEEWRERDRNPGLEDAQRVHELRQKAGQSGLWTNAADLYEKALARNPDHPEAHLRLGRVELLRGHRDEGLARLRWVTEHVAEPDLLYLAHLFTGREQKRSGQLDAALASYRAALETNPRGQAAYVATSHALHLGGDPEAAAEVLERGLAARRHTLSRDSWWRYPEGRQGQLVELLTRLHGEVCR